MGCPIPVMNKPQDEDKCHWEKAQTTDHYKTECGRCFSRLAAALYLKEDTKNKCICGKKIKVIE